MQDLINCFPDEDSHLKNFCLHRPTVTTVGDILTLLECTQGKRGRESSVRVYAMSMSACTQTLNIRQSVEAPNPCLCADYACLYVCT